MGTPPKAPDKMNKAVVACLDKSRLRGYIYDFSAIKDRFRLFPENDQLHGAGKEVALKDVKAVFFVREFGGNPNYQEGSAIDAAQHGRRMEVIFSDGEKVLGTTEAYHPQKLGFFLFPADPKSNNLRIFVVNKNVKQVKFVAQQS